MIPLKLNLKGLYSYQQETVIDFNHLTSAGLFGIFGAVGSGKSTILEAITFALYGETERLNNSDRRSYNMMNLKCNELLIEFEFETGHPAQRFKFVVKCRRNRNNFEKQSAFERSTYRWDQNNWVPDTKTADEILGLSYHNFKRTIIIPQGKFQEFLQLTDGERVKMLKEIFHLEKFELGKKVATLEKENDLAVSALQGQMYGLPEFSENILREKENCIQRLECEVKEKQAAIQAAEKEDQGLQELKKLVTNQVEKETAYKNLKSTEDSFAALEGELKQYEACQQLFQDRLAKRAEVVQAYQQRSGELANSQRQYATFMEKVEKGIKKKTEWEEAYHSREKLLQRAAELDEVMLLQSLVEKEAGLKKELAEMESKMLNEEVLEEAAENVLETLKIELRQLEEVVPDTEGLLFLQSLHTQRGSLLSKMAETSESVAALNKQKKKLEEERTVWLDSLLPELDIASESSIENILTAGKERVETLKENLQTCRNQLTDVKAHQKLEEFSAALKHGDACPLCGSTAHPQLYTAQNARKLIAEKEEEITSITAKADSLERFLKKISDAGLSIQPLETQVRELEHTLAACNDTLTSIRKALAERDLDDNSLEQSLLEAKANFKKLDRLREKREKETEKLKSISKRIQSYKDGIEKLKRELSAKGAEINTRKEKIQSLPLEAEMARSKSEIQVCIASLKESHRRITSDYEENERQLQENQKQQEKLTGTIEALTSVVSGLSGSLEALKMEITGLLQKQNLAESDVLAILAKKKDVAAERKKIATYREQLHAARVQLEEAIQKLDGRVYDKSVHHELTVGIEKLKTSHQELNDQLIGERNELTTLESDMEKRKSLQLQLDNLLRRSENLKVLANLFRSSGFVNYVSSVYLQNLISAANERFHRMTRQQLMLELTDKNDFQVVDFMNNGHVRSVKTLSGGQTFQAALSLALALADNIQQLTRSSQNFFFLDEGFGSLDKETLGIVFQTLKGLKKENRIVGVISHVDEMQQEIQVNLRIMNDSDKGSMVKKSWA